MKRLFRRPQEKGDQHSKVIFIEPKSETDLGYHFFQTSNSNNTIESVFEKASSNRRQHHRAWSLESDFRISRGELFFHATIWK